MIVSIGQDLSRYIFLEPQFTHFLVSSVSYILVILFGHDSLHKALTVVNLYCPNLITDTRIILHSQN
jgi:hypothetical protein